MVTNRRLSAARRCAVACILSVVVGVSAWGAKPQVWLMGLEIHAGPLGNNAVSADPNGTYQDYRLSPEAKNDCVEASQNQIGYTFVRLNRDLSGDAGYQDCSPVSGVPRHVSISIDSADVCEELYLYDYATPKTVGCDVHTDSEIRLSTLDHNKATKTPVVFFIGPSSQDGPGVYRIRTDSDATIGFLKTNPNYRSVVYTETATLSRVDGAALTYSDAAVPFLLPLYLSVERTALP